MCLDDQALAFEGKVTLLRPTIWHLGNEEIIGWAHPGCSSFAHQTTTANYTCGSSTILQRLTLTFQQYVWYFCFASISILVTSLQYQSVSSQYILSSFWQGSRYCYNSVAERWAQNWHWAEQAGFLALLGLFTRVLFWFLFHNWTQKFEHWTLFWYEYVCKTNSLTLGEGGLKIASLCVKDPLYR